MAEHAIAPGEVWLVGAGPGDPELLTRKAERLLQSASIVFYDALVGSGVLGLVPPGVRRVFVGKRAGRHSKDQATINDLLIAAARSGERVVRLKGGDPSIFGRSGEELEALRTAGVEARICPGVTSVSAAAAAAGVSLTQRGLAHSVRYIAGHGSDGSVPKLDWHALADPFTTIAVYMGVAAAPMLSRELIDAGLPADTPVLVAADASLPSQRLLHTRLDLLPIAVRSIAMDAPTLILIGYTVESPTGPSVATKAINGADRPLLKCRE